MLSSPSTRPCDSELGLVGDDADRAGLARCAVQRALRAGEALDPGDVVDVDVERSADRRDRLLVEIRADRRQRARVVAVAARRDAAHVDRGEARRAVWKLTDGSCLVYSSKFEMFSWSSRRVPIAWTLIGTFCRFSSRLVAVMMISVWSGRRRPGAAASAAVLRSRSCRRWRLFGRLRLPVWAKAGVANAVEARSPSVNARNFCRSSISPFEQYVGIATETPRLSTANRYGRVKYGLIGRHRCGKDAGASGYASRT